MNQLWQAADCADLDTASASTSADPNVNSDPPTLEEVMKAVQWLKNGKVQDVMASLQNC